MDNVKKHVEAIQEEFKEAYGIGVKIQIDAFKLEPSLAEKVILEFDPSIENMGYNTHKNAEWNKYTTDSLKVVMFHKDKEAVTNE
jgi:hypothetical protein